MSRGRKVWDTRNCILGCGFSPGAEGFAQMPSPSAALCGTGGHCGDTVGPQLPGQGLCGTPAHPAHCTPAGMHREFPLTHGFPAAHTALHVHMLWGRGAAQLLSPPKGWMAQPRKWRSPSPWRTGIESWNHRVVGAGKNSIF